MTANDDHGSAQGWKVSHVDSGGVADLVSTMIRWHSRSPGVGKTIMGNSTVQRDLRTLLKAGIDGERAAKPTFLSPTAVNKVLQIRPGIVSAAGIFPLQGLDKLSKVRTRFGGKQWVTRELIW